METIFDNTIPTEVRNASIGKGALALLGHFEGKDVYGYVDKCDTPPSPCGSGLPHLILYDGHNAERVYELPNNMFDYFWNIARKYNVRRLK